MKIVVTGHLMHADYPWSVGKTKRICVLPASDEGMKIADKLVDKIRQRADKKRLRGFWRISSS